eukprot:Hpha_TRINITY_DN28361_c0_g1::TRINITY_DN28361_c0_g1_i1::g.2295::m.2295
MLLSANGSRGQRTEGAATAEVLMKINAAEQEIESIDRDISECRGIIARYGERGMLGGLQHLSRLREEACRKRRELCTALSSLQSSSEAARRVAGTLRAMGLSSEAG